MDAAGARSSMGLNAPWLTAPPGSSVALYRHEHAGAGNREGRVHHAWDLRVGAREIRDHPVARHSQPETHEHRIEAPVVEVLQVVLVA